MYLRIANGCLLLQEGGTPDAECNGSEYGEPSSDSGLYHPWQQHKTHVLTYMIKKYILCASSLSKFIHIAEMNMRPSLFYSLFNQINSFMLRVKKNLYLNREQDIS